MPQTEIFNQKWKWKAMVSNKKKKKNQTGTMDTEYLSKTYPTPHTRIFTFFLF